MTSNDRYQVEHQCERLCHDFAFHLDRREYVKLAALFDENGTWIRHGERLTGARQLIDAMQGRPPDRFARHVTTNIHFADVTNELVKAVVYNVSYFAKHAGEAPAAFVAGQAMVLEFWDEYVRTDRGWRIRERDTRPVLVPEAMIDEMMGRH